MKKMPLFEIRSCRNVVTIFVMTLVVISFGNRVFSSQNGNTNQNTPALVDQISQACESAKQAVVKEITAPLTPNPKTETLRQISMFRVGIRKIFPKATVQKWEDLFMLDEMQQSLREAETDLELLGEILDLLDGDGADFQRPSFIRLKKSLVANRLLLWRQNQKSHIEEVEAVFDSLPGLVDRYLQSPDVANAEAVSDCLKFLAETHKADNLVALIHRSIMQPNLKVRVNSNIIATFFLRDVDEQVTVNDIILGTWVRGSGQMIGETRAAYVPSRDSAIIRVTLEGQLDTKTVGSQGPLRIPSNNTTMVKTTKDIVISNDSIKTTPAKTDANLTSQVGKIEYTRPAPLVRMVAPSQIDQRKPASDAESERLTKLRFNSRFNSEVDEIVAAFNEEMMKLFNGRNDAKSLRLQFDQMETTRSNMSVEAVVRNKFQLTALTKPPTVTTKAELLFQVHESLASNAGECELGGKTLFEEQFLAKLKDLFPQMPEKQENDDTNEPMLTIAFSDRPIEVSFKNNVIKAVVETTAIERAGTDYPGMVIEFTFRIEAAGASFRLVVAETPEVLPLGFDPEKGLSMRETTIRAIVKKKLERITAEPMEWKVSVIKGNNGIMMLKPVHLSTRDGWLSVGLNLVQWMPNTESEN